MNTTSNPIQIQTLRNQGITINTNDKEATRRMQDEINEMAIKLTEEQKAAANC